MIYRYFSWIIWLVPVLGTAQVSLEAAIKFSQGRSFLNDRPTDLPFLVDEDDSYTDIYFYSEKVTTESLPGFELYGGLKGYDIPIIFGMSFSLNTLETRFQGETRFADGTPNGTFAIQKRGVGFTMNYRFGYRHNGFKTLRPFAFVDLGLLSDYSDKILTTDVTYGGFDGTPDLQLYSSIEIKRRMGICIGVEWRDLAFSLDYHRMREQLVYDGEGKELSYSKRRIVSLGISYILKGKVYKSKSDVTPGLKTGFTKTLEMVNREPKFFSLVGGLSGNIWQGGYGITNSKLLDGDYSGDASFMKVTRVYSDLSSTTKKETAEVAIMTFDNYSSENTGIPRFSLGGAFHLNQLELDIMGQYFRLNNRQHYDYSFARYSRYIINDEPQSYTFEPNSFNYDYEFYLNNDISVYGYTISLKYKFKPNDFMEFPTYLGVGWHMNYFRIDNSYYEQNHSTAVALAEDMTQAFNGGVVDEDNPSYYNMSDEYYYLSDDEFIELLETPDLRFNPLSEISANRNSSFQKMSGLTFYFGFPVGRFDFHFGYETSKTKDIYLVRSLNNWIIGVNYHLWGW